MKQLITLMLACVALAACTKTNVNPKVNKVATALADTASYCKPCNDVGTVQ